MSTHMSTRLGLAAKYLYKSQLRTKPHMHIYEVCKMLEGEGVRSAEQMIYCYDIGIVRYGNLKDIHNEYFFVKEKYRSLLKLGFWEEADRFVSALDKNLVQSGWPHVLKARALSACGKVEESVAEWRIVLGMRPHDEEAIKALSLP